MKRAIVFVVAVMCFVSLFSFAADSPKAPKYIWVQTVSIAGDKSEPYINLVGQLRHAADTLKTDSYWISASAMTGDLRQITFVSFYDNMAAAEKDIMGYSQISAELKRGNPNFWTEIGAIEQEPRAALAMLREELSYQPDKIPYGEAKWWRIKTLHLAPGARMEFADLMKEEIDILTRAKVDEPFLVFEVSAGVPTTGQVYYIVTEMKSLAEMDTDNSEQLKPFLTPLVREHFQTVARKIVTRAEDNLFMIRPELSRPPQTYVAANPDFWTIKESEPVAAKGKAKPKKPAKMVENIPPTVDKN